LLSWDIPYTLFDCFQKEFLFLLASLFSLPFSRNLQTFFSMKWKILFPFSFPSTPNYIGHDSPYCGFFPSNPFPLSFLRGETSSLPFPLSGFLASPFLKISDPTPPFFQHFEAEDFLNGASKFLSP